MEEQHKNYKFCQIDPENCSIEELENEVERLKNLGDFYETKQLALKKFINSVYGATASKYFIAHNTAVAESITLQGQDLNHYSENSVNAYFSGIFQNDTELHKKLGIDSEKAKKVSIAKGKTTETGTLDGPEFSYLDGNQSLTVAGDTDTSAKDTKIFVDNCEITMEDFFTKAKYENDDIVIKLQNGSEVIPVHNHNTLTYQDHDYKTSERPINYIMRHKITKDRFRLRTKTGKELIVTGDHSIMIIRNNELISIPAREIKKTDKIITLDR
mgnify:CR=1 FL=1